MNSLPFFLGLGKLRYWYILFYILALPIYIFGIYLLSKVQATHDPKIREFVLNIFTFGYLLLGLFSLINTILYVYNTKKFFFGFFVFFGIQLLFWMIGNTFGNNYPALMVFFSMFLLIVVYINLKALEHIRNNRHHPKDHHKK